MSIRSFGMVGKTYNSASEAFKDADYACALTHPNKPPTGSFWAFVGALIIVGIFGYGFWLTITRF